MDPTGWNGALNGVPAMGLMNSLSAPQTGVLMRPAAAQLSPYGTSANRGLTLRPGSGTAQPSPAGTGGNGAPASRPGSLGGLLNTASGFQFPVTSGLLSSLYQTPQSYSGPDYSQIALQMAGNPHAGPYAEVPIPSGIAVTGAGNAGSTGSSGGSTGSQILGGLLGMLNNPLVSSGLKSLLGDLLGTGSDAALGTLGGAPLGSAVTDATTQAADGITGSGGLDLSGQLASDTAGNLGAVGGAGSLATLAGAPLGAAVTGATDAAATSLMPGITSDFASTIGADTAANLAATDAGAAAGASPAAGALTTVAAPVAIAALPAILASLVPQGPSNAYYQNMLNTVAAGPPSGPQILANGAEDPQWAAYNAARGELSTLQGDSGGIIGNGYSVPDWVTQQIAQLGITPITQTAANVNANGGARGGGSTGARHVNKV